MKRSGHWMDWRWQMRNAVNQLDQDFCNQFQMDFASVQKVQARYPVRLTPYAIERLEAEKEWGPIHRQMLPCAGELIEEEGIGSDPFSEKGKAALCYGLKQRFPDRALIMTNDSCAMACRHCTRKGLLGKAEVVRTPEQLQKVVDWVQQHPAVREVLLSGGDPLLLSDRKIVSYVEAFAALPQIDAVRIGTRVLSTLPMRITPGLAKALGKTRKVWVNTQFNHASELTETARTACRLLADEGIPVSNQSVLLKGVNDSPYALFDLCSGLQRDRVRPYYVFVCDPVAGIAHFRVSIEAAVRLERALAERIGGLAMPRFVADLPGRKRKMPVSEVLAEWEKE